MNLKNIVQNLINSKQEGAHWDFKEKWYEEKNQGDLLHDIICFSNNLVDKDCYIILGVEDKTFETVGIENDPNRKTTQNITDFLRDKPFVRGIRPIVVVNSVTINNSLLDIITIKNSINTPFYLTSNYKNVYQNNIYTRIQDSNTPKNRSADFDKIEYLWRKRFGLLYTPLEKINLYLSDKKMWRDSNTENESIKYYSSHPEFTIRYVHDDSTNGYEFYFFNQTDSRSSWYNISLYYHQTLLADFQGVSLDGRRYFTPIPERDVFFVEDHDDCSVQFRYFTKDSLLYSLHNFYFNEDSHNENIARNKFLKCILIFSNDDEKEMFINYAKENFAETIDNMDNLYTPRIKKIEGHDTNYFEQEFINIKVLKEIYKTFVNQ